MEITIKINGRMVSVEVSAEVSGGRIRHLNNFDRTGENLIVSKEPINHQLCSAS